MVVAPGPISYRIPGSLQGYYTDEEDFGEGSPGTGPSNSDAPGKSLVDDSQKSRAQKRGSESLDSRGSQMYWDTSGDISGLMDEYDRLLEDGMADVLGNLHLKPGPDESTAYRGNDELMQPHEGTDNFEGTETMFVAEGAAIKERPLISEEPYIIAHHDILLPRMRKLSTGVQWEISRLISRGTISYGDIPFGKLAELEGPSTEAAPRVSRFFKMLKREKTENSERQDERREKTLQRKTVAKTPWSALDEEEKYLNESQYAALGCQIGNDGADSKCSSVPSDYYGGRVHFLGSVIEIIKSDDPKSSSFRVELEKTVLGYSYRFGRRFGSSRFLKLSVPKSVLYSKNPEKTTELKKLLVRPFVLNGFVYRMFFTRGTSVFLVRTDEHYANLQILPARADSPSPLKSLTAFLSWHNPMQLNKTQNVAKWVDRFALGLSNTVPGVVLKQSNIIQIDDDYAPGYQVSETMKPPSEMIMTDGCGFANKAAFRAISQRCSFETKPSALHIRLGGAKGLLLLRPDEPEEDDPTVPKVWIRKSQLKIEHPLEQPLEPANLVIDVLRCSKVRTPCTISYEFIINLHANGVDTIDFIQLMKSDMKDLADRLMTWEGPLAMQRLFKNLCEHGGLITSRLAREAGGESRIHGLWDRRTVDKLDEENWGLLPDDISVDERSTAWCADEVSGYPSSLEETLVTLLSAGFTPYTSPMCATMLFDVFKGALGRFKQKYRITVPGSARAFIVPDPLGVLKRGEIFFSPSQPVIGPDGLEMNILLGEVLVGRNPCKLPSDVEKVVAIDCDRLRKYRDVIVFSIADYQSPASRLSGGDYDGDEIIVIWQPEIVCNFKNAELRNPRECLKDAFEQVKETVSDFLDRAPLEDILTHVQELQTYLLNPLFLNTQTAPYYNMHLNSAYMHGYADPRTTRLGHMFNQCLDGPKAGLICVKAHVLKDDYKMFLNFRRAEWQSETSPNYDDESNFGNLRRDASLHGNFVMDEIRDAIKEEEAVYLRGFDNHLSTKALYALDEDLVKPWCEMEKRVEAVYLQWNRLTRQSELRKIQQHVDAAYTRRTEKYKELMQRLDDSRRKAPYRKRACFTDLPQAVRRDFLRSNSIEFASGPSDLVFFDDKQICELRASYAYLYSSKMESGMGWLRFPWEVAFGALCKIKAEALGTQVSVVRDFYEFMTMHRSVDYI